MKFRLARAMLGFAIAVLASSVVLPVASASSPSYLTTAITQSGSKQTTISGYNGVLVNYTSKYSTSFGAFVYLDLVNSAGQNVYWNVGYCSFGPYQKVQCFVVISSTVPKGTYTALVFAATNSSVPVSSTSSLHVTV